MTSPLEGPGFSPLGEPGLPRPSTPPRPPTADARQSSRRVVLVGPDGAVLELARRLRADPGAGLAVLGACVPQPSRSAELVAEGLPVLGRMDQVIQVLSDVPADGVLVAPAPETSGAYLRRLARRAKRAGLEVLVGPGDLGAAESGRPTAVPFCEVDSRDPVRAGRVAKAVLDRLGAGVLLLLSAVWLVLIALAVKLASPGPIMSRHRSIGQWGREFDLLRFRSTVWDDEAADAALTGSAEPTAARSAMRCDPRITPLGRFLRRFSLDELPQLVNVLKGDMSLVGPRPQLGRERVQGVVRPRSWLPVKPGLTGLWQLRGSSDHLDGPLELDQYVQHWSLALDLRILVRSIRFAVSRRGC